MIKTEWTNKDALDLQPTCNQLATDLISRDEVHKTLSLLATEGGTDAKMLLADAHEFIDALPSADTVSREDTVTLNSPISIQAEMVAVTRCKDCKHGQYDATHYFCAEHGHKVYEDDFCSRGERRSNRGEEVNGFKSVGQAWNTSQGRWEP